MKWGAECCEKHEMLVSEAYQDESAVSTPAPRREGYPKGKCWKDEQEGHGVEESADHERTPECA